MARELVGRVLDVPRFRRIELLALLIGLPLGASACRGDARPAPSASASARAAESARPDLPAPAEQRLKALLAAEQRRDSLGVSQDDISHRDVRVRRAAARALARIADARSRATLRKVLADEDREVVAFSAYGLGYACAGAEPETVRALNARAAALLAAKDAKAPSEGLDAVAAIADALGRCGTADAERTLRAWLGAPARHVAESAALALGRVASQQGRLEDASLVALLDAASRPKDALESALFAFTRLTGLGAPVQSRLLEVAGQNASRQGLARTLALRALAAAGDEAAPILEQAIQNRSLPATERAEAARTLNRLGERGQAALRSVLGKLLPPADQPLSVAGAEFGVYRSLLDALKPPVREGADVLGRLAELPLPEGAAERRRAVSLRCRAAALLAGRATLSPRLRACDPDAEGRAGKLATLSVLDEGKLTGARATRFRELAADSDSVVRQQALRLLGGHPESVHGPDLLAAALGSKNTGDVTTAANVLARYPERGGNDGGALKPKPNVIAALNTAFEATRTGSALEARAELLDAAAALQLLGFKSRTEIACKSDRPSLRQAAQKALRLLGERQRLCQEFEPATSAVPEVERALRSEVVLSLDTDQGALEIRLDPRLAPVAVTRVVELAREGFYDGMAVHRVVPGFVAQFGDRDGDGFGGAERPPLRCESSPVPFGELDVGMALAGRDTATSQLFVALGRFPHLDGEYTVIGRASGPWASVTEGDVIRKVRVNARASE